MKDLAVIKSTGNAKVKQLSRLQKNRKAREEQKVMLVEGLRLVKEVPAASVLALYVSEAWLEKNKNEALLTLHEYTVFSDTVFSHVSDTKTPQGILALVKQPTLSVASILQKKPAHILMLYDLQDPGNVGTIIRTAEACEVTGVILSKNCVDIFNPKTVRSTMGSIFRVPICLVEDWEATCACFRQEGIQILATNLEKSRPFYEVDYKEGTAFLIGNEGQGLPTEVIAMADASIHIPMDGEVESLNAAVATALCAYEVKRQRNELTR